MAQKSILSFFSVKSTPTVGSSTPKSPAKSEDRTVGSSAPKSPDKSVDNQSDGDSPIKSTRRKRQRIESSSSEDETAKSSSVAQKLAKFSAVKKMAKVDPPVKPIVEPLPSGNVEMNGREIVTNGKIQSPEKKNGIKEKSISPEMKNGIKKESKSPKMKNGTKDESSDGTEASEKMKSPKEKIVKKKTSPKAKNDSKEKSSKAKNVSKMESSNNKSAASSDKSAASSDSKEINTDSYNPSESKYHPINHACWKHGENVPYYALSRTLEEIEKTSARLRMIEILSNYLRSVIVLSPNDFLPSIYLCLNKIGPAYEGLELGLAEQTLIRAISQSTGRTFTQIKNDVQETGDLGSVAERSRTSQRLMFKPQPLNVQGVFKKFRDIASMSGKAVVDKKISIIQALYVACKGPEARFLIRSLNGKLRIGLAEQSVLQAIAVACATTPPCQDYPPKELNAAKNHSTDSFKSKVEELALVLKTTYCECPNYDMIVPVILKEGILALPEHCKITPGIPVKPMLAQPTKGVQEVLTRFDGLEFTCEWKYDGERAQIHRLEDGSINIYSRNQENNTSKYPDIISRMEAARKEDTTTFILDCEAVAWDKEEKRILPFQVLSTRKRKDANEAEIKVQVCVFMFDLLYLNGKSLVTENFFERRRLLQEHFQEVEGQWKFATALDTCKMEEVQQFLEESIKGHCEGLMVKTLKEDATYEIAKRSRNWLKLKKDYLEGVGDTLDLVVMGGYFGKGKRTGTYGGFLVGCYDEDSEEYQTLCKIGTGFSDEDLQTHTQFFKDHIASKAPPYYQHDASLTPDHWFSPVQVWETRCADLSLSPVHRAGVGLIDPEKGISLRFPRFLRIRDDKKPEEATSARQVADMYLSQEQVQAQGKSSAFNEEDFY